MMKVQNRITLHFILQLILYSVFVIIALLTLVFILIGRMTNEEMKQNVPVGALQAVTSEALYENGSITLNKYWDSFLVKHQLWLQIINSNGKVIHTINKPDDVPEQYNLKELREIKEQHAYGSYFIESELDLFEAEPLLYLIGYKSPLRQQLLQWYNAYEQNGRPDETAITALEDELNQIGGYLTIINHEGKKLYTIGKEADNDSNELKPLELLAIQDRNGDHSGQITMHVSDDGLNTWILHKDRDMNSYVKQPIFSDIIRSFGIAAIAILALSLLLSFWLGYRYSQPLILFAGWFNRMESGNYDEVLTAKDKRKVFRRNGKLRTRYRLYREAIHNFYEMAQRLAQTEKDRQRLERSREQWMSGISHDLRTPLSTIQGYAYILEQSPEQWSKDELQEMGRMIREKGDFMLELITDFSYINQLKQTDALAGARPIELNRLVRHAIIKYVNDATLTGVDFQYEDDEADAVIIQGNELWLLRLMDNLIFNAIKHNAPGITITTTVEKKEHSASISVADNGQGMDSDTQAMLFERYYRGTNSEESSSGSGLGMSIAKMIVEAHHGNITVKSQINQGTIITVRFPLSQTN
ncbi:sensor histidine kinase [Paenibacillus sp. GXUN7292]|uniref:sensor histidine kinase n=1 Tax=Paenibacillus sp. GXUN7292 TaxID=3422499 RepID=UPI003D7D9CFD